MASDGKGMQRVYSGPIHDDAAMDADGSAFDALDGVEDPNDVLGEDDAALAEEDRAEAVEVARVHAVPLEELLALPPGHIPSPHAPLEMERSKSSRARRANHVIMERRVTMVFGALVSGLQAWEIRRAVHEAQTSERRKRDKARQAAIAARARDPEFEAVSDVPIVWGDIRIGERTIDAYIEKAREVLDSQGDQFAKQRTRMLATQQARLDSIYAKAMQGGKFYAALKAVELSAELFNLREHARAMALVTPEDHGDDEEGNPKLLPTDPIARANAFNQLIGAAIESDPRLRDQLVDIMPRPPIMP